MLNNMDTEQQNIMTKTRLTPLLYSVSKREVHAILLSILGEDVYANIPDTLCKLLVL